MEKIVAPFIQNPVSIFIVAGIFFAAYLFLRNSPSFSHSKALLWPAMAWTLWAIWEFFITRSSPEANIRVDLLLIVPIVLIAMAYGIIRAFLMR